MKKIKAAEAILDFTIYPRVEVDAQHVSTLAEVFRSGGDLPPVVIDKKSKRVVDGFHRVRAALRAFGDDAKILAVEKAYRNEREMFLDAMRYNASHGRMLAAYDRAHCAIRAEELGIDDELLAGALSISPERLGQLRTDRTATSGGLHVPLKRTFGHLAGGRLTKRQADANRKLSGMPQTFYVNQLITIIESGGLDVENAALAAGLAKLRGLLNKVLKKAA